MKKSWNHTNCDFYRSIHLCAQGVFVLKGHVLSGNFSVEIINEFWHPDPNCCALISQIKKRSVYWHISILRGKTNQELRSKCGVCQRGALLSLLHGQRWLKAEIKRLLQCNEARIWYETINYWLQQPIFPHPSQDWRGGRICVGHTSAGTSCSGGGAS